ISNVSVTLRSHVITYWPEGIGSRGTRLTHEKMLGEQIVQIVAPNQEKNNLVLQAGTHRFSFAFVIPNSTVATIEDTFGRVKHVIEAQVQRPGIAMLSNWTVSKPVLILRTYMSNSLLTNNSLATLSRTFEKHMIYGDIEVVIEAAAFSSGDLFYIRMVIEPQLKHTRIEHMEVSCIESRKYCVPEMKAWRTDHTVFPMPFAGSVRLAEFGEVNDTTDELRPIFDKHGQGIDLVHDFAHRLAFFSPTCQQHIRHTTYIREILIKHHIEINLTLSYVDDEGHRQFLSRNNSNTSIESIELSGTLTPPPQAHISNNIRTLPSHHHHQRHFSSPLPTPTTSDDRHQWHLLRLNKTKIEKEKDRKKETITLDSPITVFDCRLKEDYGRLPSYNEIGIKPTEIDKKIPKNKNDDVKMDQPQPHPYLCSCYYTFCKDMELASQSLYLSTKTATPLIDQQPPPAYSIPSDTK
ncbi:hypothetical protein CU097_000288, partial [Rhizopus azygosporus]